MEILTQGEQDKIQARLGQLKANRIVLSQRIADARALGDLRENSEYHAAREQQGVEEAEIRRLEERLARCQVIDAEKMRGTEVVFLGSIVKLRDVDNGREDIVKLVGEMSSEPPDGYDEVTVTSPMGEALMKSRVGETVRVNAPRGVKRFEIVELL
jgi:transcription elongation factor GreA